MKFPILKILAGFSGLLFLVAALVRDSIPGSLALYVVFPMALSGLGFLPLGIHKAIQKKWKAAFLLFVLPLLPAAVHFGYLLDAEQPPVNLDRKRSVRVLAWTLDNYEYTNIETAFASMATYDPDVILLVEGNVDHGSQNRYGKEFFPNHSIHLLDHGLLLLHRGNFLGNSSFTFDQDRGSLEFVHLRIHGQKLGFAIYDQHSFPTYSRAPSIRKLVETLEPSSGDFLLLYGDFNTPIRSYAMKPLRKLLVDTRLRASSGNPYSFPEPLPFKSFDRLFISDPMANLPQKGSLIPTAISTHRIFLFEFELPESKSLPSP